MLHKIKLKESPFERIKNGTKTIEFRLYDEIEIQRKTIWCLRNKNFTNKVGR